MTVKDNSQVKIDSQVEVIAIGTDKHVPIPEFYEETIEVIDRELPGTVKDSQHITKAHWYNFERLPQDRFTFRNCTNVQRRVRCVLPRGNMTKYA